MKSQPTKAYTFASRSSLDSNQSLQKSILSSTLRENKKSATVIKNKTLPTHNTKEINRTSELIGNGIAMMIDKKEGQLVTRYIKHLAESADFKGGTFNKQCNGLIGYRFEMPNVSYTHPSDCLKTPSLP